jgi:hypothetical protein
MTNPSPREVIASTVARDSSPREELEASRLADQVLEALRSRGYEVRPIPPPHWAIDWSDEPAEGAAPPKDT